VRLIRTFRTEILFSLFLVLITSIAYGSVCSNGFTNYDDDIYVTENPHVRAGFSADSLWWALTASDASNWHPLTWISLQLDCELYGLRPWGYHLTNLLFHVFNALLLFWWLRVATGAIWRSAAVASLFAVHPVHVESVTWITERKDVLSFFFGALALWAYLGFVKQPGGFRYLLIMAAFALSLMAKPMFVTLPFLLLLVDYWPLGRMNNEGRAVENETATLTRRASEGESRLGHTLTRSAREGPSLALRVSVVPLVYEKLPLFAVSGISSFITVLVQPTQAIPLPVRVSNALASYVAYLRLITWPKHLAVFYPYPVTSSWLVGLGAGVLLASISVLVIWAARRKPYLPVGWFWYLGTLIPVIGLVQVGLQGMADRYAYLPAVGLYIMLSWGATELVGRWRRGNLLLISLTSLVLVASMMCTWRQVSYWHDSIALWEHTLQVTKDNWLAHANLGSALLPAGRFDEAIPAFQEAIRLKPDSAIYHNNLAAALIGNGRLDEAIAELRQAIRLDPSYGAYNNLGLALEKQGRLNEAASAVWQAVRLQPNSPGGHYRLSTVLQAEGRLDFAIHELEEAIRLKPDFAEAYHALGIALGRQGKLPEAIVACREAIRLKPDDADAYNNLGVALMRQGNVGEAVAAFQEAVHLKPDDANARANLDGARTALGK
jgi:tetratricopeptide (TPR) repeat protein